MDISIAFCLQYARGIFYRIGPEEGKQEKGKNE
jgi:hypothetical protein